MEIHRFEAVWFVAAVLLILAFIGTVAYGTVGAGVAMVDDSGGTVDPGAVGSADGPEEFQDPGVRKAGPNEYDVYMLARQFQFQPGSQQPVRVPAGATVTFHITSPDVQHGFSIAGTNVNTMVIPGQVSEITATFEEAKTYGIVCHEYCGSGHHTMAGTLEVVPQSEWEGVEN